MSVGQADQLPHMVRKRIPDKRKCVGKRDVDVPDRDLRRVGRLRCPRIRLETLQEQMIQRGSALETSTASFSRQRGCWLRVHAGGIPHHTHATGGKDVYIGMPI